MDDSNELAAHSESLISVSGGIPGVSGALPDVWRLFQDAHAPKLRSDERQRLEKTLARQRQSQRRAAGLKHDPAAA
jgi:hypothetical protein